MSETNLITRTTTNSCIFAYSYWDTIPVLCAILHFGYLVGMYVLFPRTSLLVMLPLGLLYSVSISWNINGIAHNFIHNPYFRSPLLNRLFSLLESLTMGFSQAFYDCVHMRHHMGNSDRKDETGDTIDWLSIYRYGENGKAENVWRYTFKSFFRDDPKLTYAEMKRKSKADAVWGIFEIVAFVTLYAIAFIANWKFMIFFLPFYYFGNALSSLNGFYRHYGGNPDLPIAWGVSSYHRLYNWLWFNNGYHAEHHYRPRVHWTKMEELHQEIKQQQRIAKVRVLSLPHALGFLDHSLHDLKMPEPDRVAVGSRRR